MVLTHTTQQKSAPLVAESKPAKKPVKFVHHLLRNLLWLPLSLLIVIVVVESVFYVAHIGEEEFLKIVPTVGFSHLENKLVTFRSEGFSQDRINSHGFRDGEYPIAKLPRTARIAILGDSKTEAFQVPLKDTFGKFLERHLNGRGTIYGGSKLNGGNRCKYQVLNFGMSAFGTAQEYILYCTQVSAYKPDITIVMYHIQDIDENVLPLGDPNPLPRPYFSLNQAHALQIDWGAVHCWLKSDRARIYAACDGLRRNSRIWGVFAKLEPTLHTDSSFLKLESIWSRCFDPICTSMMRFLPSYKWNAPSIDQIDPSLKLSSFSSADYRSHCYKNVTGSIITHMSAQSPESQEIQTLFRIHEERWKVASALLHQLNKACQATGSHLVVAALPAPNNSIFYFRELRHMQEQAKHDGFTFINLHKEFPSIAPMTKSPLYYSNHFSKQGHRLLANILYQQLTRAGLSRGDSL